MTTPYWAEKFPRPIKDGHQALISYEIYGKGILDEHDVVLALNELVEEGKANLFYKSNGDGPWYVLKEESK